MSAHTTTQASFGGDVATSTAPVGVITSMLKEYLPYELLFEELTKRDYLLTKVDKDQSWKGGELSVPFMGGNASSFAYGELTAISDITEDRPVRGKVSEYREIWGSMVFHQKDLDTHQGSMEQSFLKILPDRLEHFIEKMKEAVSINLLNGQHFDTIDFAGTTAPQLAAGKLKVSRVARFSIGQYVTFGTIDEGTNLATFKYAGYVRNIDISASLIEVVVAKDVFSGGYDTTPPVIVEGGTEINFGANTVSALDILDANDKVYLRGSLGAGTINAVGENTGVAVDNTVRRGFTSLRSQMLSDLAGGSKDLFGMSKLLYPHLQCPNFDGSGMTTLNLLDQIFDNYNSTRILGKGAPTEVLMSYKSLGVAMKQIQAGLVGTGAIDTGATSANGTPQRINAGGYSAGAAEANAFGWTTIQVTGVQGSLKLVGIQEMDDDVMFIMDWRALKLHSNGFFERRQAPDGKEYFEERTTSGYKYVIDTRFYGEMILTKPSHCGIIHTISL